MISALCDLPMSTVCIGVFGVLPSSEFKCKCFTYRMGEIRGGLQEVNKRVRVVNSGLKESPSWHHEATIDHCLLGDTKFRKEGPVPKGEALPAGRMLWEWPLHLGAQCGWRTSGASRDMLHPWVVTWEGAWWLLGATWAPLLRDSWKGELNKRPRVLTSPSTCCQICGIPWPGHCGSGRQFRC